MAATPLGTYETVQTITADPGRIVVTLFDGAARFIRQAQRALDRRDLPRFAASVSRAHAIIAELSNVLDREKGGELAATLGRLYAFMLRHLTEGLVTKSRRHLDEVLVPLQAIREGFEGAVEARRRG